MAISNHERVGKGLTLLAEGLRPFVDKYLGEKVPNGDWASMLAAREQARQGVSRQVNADDPSVLLKVLVHEWRAFEGQLSRSQQAMAQLLLDSRNAWAHNKPVTTEDAYRALDIIEQLLIAVGSPEQAEAARKLRVDMQRSAYDTAARKTSQQLEAANVDGLGLRPWREVITPHADVISGDFTASEFAADLQRVSEGEGSEEYVDPGEFFRRTYITRGLRDLMSRALRRIGGDGNAAPIVNLQTNFGGGKTHSMLALFHLFGETPLDELPQEVQEIAEGAGVSTKATVGPPRRVVLVGTWLHPGSATEKPDGTRVNTIWGELAWQLGGRAAYDVVADADRTRTNPGGALTTLIREHAPCLILVDEWVAYARQLFGDETFAAGSFETQFTFAQTLTEAVTAVPGAMLVVSIPASDRPEYGASGGSAIEVGGQYGEEALQRLQSVVGRTADQWTPASSEESFEIVRRRLFDEPDAQARNTIAAVARAYGDFYRKHRGEFPPEALDPAYERRMAAAYPIHPELFDRLYEDWSTLPRFQRTRGVLRLMSSVVHELWRGGDAAPMILPGSVPLDRARVTDELAQYLEDAWKPIIDTDIDGPGSTPVEIDKQRSALGSRFLTRRTARAIFVASAPTLKGAHKGVEVQRARLGTAIPGDTVGNFGSALQLLADRSTYLYVEHSRYWYEPRPSMTRTARDYAERLADEDVWAEIERRLRQKEVRQAGLFAAVHAAPESSADVRDTEDARLVIIGPRHPHESKAGGAGSPALRFAEECLKTRGSANRINRNMIVFLAAASREIGSVEQAVRDHEGWKHVYEHADKELNLTAAQRNQAKARMDTTDETVNARINDAWTVLIKPDQPDPARPAGLVTSRCAGSERMAERAGKTLRREDALVVDLGANVIRYAVTSKAPAAWASGHVSAGEVWKLCREYPYMPRLRDISVLEDAVRAALSLITWEREGFALATGYDEQAGRYQGLAIPHEDDFAGISDSTLLVMPEVALRQRYAERAESPAESGRQAEKKPDVVHHEPKIDVVYNADFHGVRRLDPEMYGRDWNKIANEVIAHLAAVDGVDLQITVDIRAHAPDGIPEGKARTVSENAKVLKFEVAQFDDGTAG
jgi:predicted AAA+ superfamily ATPase